MKFNIHIYILFFTTIFLTACQNEMSNYVKIEPAQLEHIEGSDVEKITLTEKAAERIGIELTTIQENDLAVDPNIEAQKVVPYAAVLYDTEGKTWVYTSPKNLIFIRKEIVIDHIKGDQAFLKAGPPVGTNIVIQGASELLGTEFHVGH